MHVDKSEPSKKVFPMKFSPPKQAGKRSPAITPVKERTRRKGVQKFIDGLKSNKSLKWVDLCALKS